MVVEISHATTLVLDFKCSEVWNAESVGCKTVWLCFQHNLECLLHWMWLWKQDCTFQRALGYSQRIAPVASLYQPVGAKEPQDQYECAYEREGLIALARASHSGGSAVCKFLSSVDM